MNNVVQKAMELFGAVKDTPRFRQDGIALFNVDDDKKYQVAVYDAEHFQVTDASLQLQWNE